MPRGCRRSGHRQICSTRRHGRRACAAQEKRQQAEKEREKLFESALKKFGAKDTEGVGFLLGSCVRGGTPPITAMHLSNLRDSLIYCRLQVYALCCDC